MTEIRCFACQALVPDVEGPVHRYQDASPGCWAMYGEVLAREYSDRDYYRNHRLTVDAYSVQHPGKPSSPQAVQSVGVHLSALYMILEQGLTYQAATRFMAPLTEDKSRFFWLEPPADLGGVTVRDVWEAKNVEEHLAKVEQWAAVAWSAWEPHHPQIKAWADQVQGS